MKPKIEGLLRVNVWRIVDDGIESPIRFGIRRSCKHGAVELTDEQEEILVEKIQHELMNWFAEVFIFDDNMEEE